MAFAKILVVVITVPVAVCFNQVYQPHLISKSLVYRLVSLKSNINKLLTLPKKARCRRFKKSVHLPLTAVMVKLVDTPS